MSCNCVPCKECGGTGDVFLSYDGEYLGNARSDDMDEIETCPECEGSGFEYFCEECRAVMEEMEFTAAAEQEETE